VGSITITPEVWAIEKNLAIESIDTTGHLPESNQVGAKFWSMVREHYVNAVDTDHLARFDHYHCLFVDRVEAQFPITPPPPTLCITPVVPVTPPPSHPGTPSCPIPPPPGGGANAIPEPASLGMFGIGIVVALLARRIHLPGGGSK